MQKIMMMAVLISGLFLAGSIEAQTNKLITKNSVGKVKIGMTLAQVRKTLGPLTLGKAEAASEGDMSYPIKQGKNLVMTIVIGGGASLKGKVAEIMVLDRSYKTADGVHVGMLLSEAEKKYGQIKEISDDMEMEMVTFTNQPEGFSFTLAGSGKGKLAGIYDKDDQTATKYHAGAKLKSIEITY